MWGWMEQRAMTRRCDWRAIPHNGVNGNHVYIYIKDDARFYSKPSSLYLYLSLACHHGTLPNNSRKKNVVLTRCWFLFFAVTIWNGKYVDFGSRVVVVVQCVLYSIWSSIYIMTALCITLRCYLLLTVSLSISKCGTRFGIKNRMYMYDVLSVKDIIVEQNSSRFRIHVENPIGKMRMIHYPNSPVFVILTFYYS